MSEDPNARRVKAPAFLWYPGDWRRDTALQACTFEARGLWREMIDLMHDGEPYGHLTAGGRAIADNELARIVGVQVAKARRWLAELEERKVFSRTDAGVIYSRRMLRDEHIRSVRRAAGKLGGNPQLKRATGDDGPTSVNPDGSDVVKQTDGQNPTLAVAVAVAGCIDSSIASPSSPSARDAFVWHVRKIGGTDEIVAGMIDAADRSGRPAEEIDKAMLDFIGKVKSGPTVSRFGSFLAYAGPRPEKAAKYSPRHLHRRPKYSQAELDAMAAKFD